MKESFSPLYELDSHGSTVSLKKFGRQQVSKDEVDVKLHLVSSFNHANVSVKNIADLQLFKHFLI